MTEGRHGRPPSPAPAPSSPSPFPSPSHPQRLSRATLPSSSPPSSSSSSFSSPWIVASLLLSLLSTTSALCQFPEEWRGTWFRSGMGEGGPINISGSVISKTGECIEEGEQPDRYLVREAAYNCHKCMVIYMRHRNIIQYKESYCDDLTRDLTRLCAGITGDAMMYSMFRLNAAPVACPFHGPLTFTYSKGYGECTNPVSQVDSCAEEYRLLFRHQACADVPGSESFLEELVCQGSWKEGSNHYLAGKINHIHAKSDEDRYRCFILERANTDTHGTSTRTQTHTWNLAQSADATCQGLISAHEGSKIMKLTKVSHSGRKCHFPSWVSGAGRHWLTLDGRHSYFLYHKNTSLRISNGTQAPQNVETRGHTDVRLVCHHYEGRTHHHHTTSSLTTTTTTTTTDHHHHHNNNNNNGNNGNNNNGNNNNGNNNNGNNNNGNKDNNNNNNNNKNHHMNEDHVTLVAHVTYGCKSGYKCLRLYRRDQQVIQIRAGDLAYSADEACTNHYWEPKRANLTTLVSARVRSSSCGPYGHYKPHTDARGYTNEVTCATVAGQTYTHVSVGCSTPEGNILKLDVGCPEKSVLEYHCNGRWESEGVTYVVASPMSRASSGPRRVCFTYTPVTAHATTHSAAHTHTITARHDICEASVHDAHIAINVTLEGQCVQVPGSSTSLGSRSRIPPLLSLALSLSSLSLSSSSSLRNPIILSLCLLSLSLLYEAEASRSTL